MTNVTIQPADHDGLRGIMVCKSNDVYVVIISDDLDTAYVKVTRNQMYNLRSQLNHWLTKDDDDNE